MDSCLYRNDRLQKATADSLTVFGHAMIIKRFNDFKLKYFSIVLLSLPKYNFSSFHSKKSLEVTLQLSRLQDKSNSEAIQNLKASAI
jgi:hypothetical protein